MKRDSLFRRDSPAIAARGVHLDLKGLPPTPARLLTLLDLFAAARFNCVLVEWEDAFPWDVDMRFRGECAYAPADVDAFHRRAAELGLAIIPLVQSLGHMETVLCLDDYQHLREAPHRCDTLNPLAPGARDLVERMIEDVLGRSGRVTHFHLGGDEAFAFGTNPDTKAYVERHGKAALYLHHVEPLLCMLLARGIRPILWHDMMHDWDAASLARLGAKADVMVWSYHGHPDNAAPMFNTRVIERFREAGVTVWGASAYKGADGRGDAERPDPEARAANAAGWANLATRYALRGVVATGWSRYQTARVQCEPIDGALDALLRTAFAFHDAAACDGPTAERFLSSIGEIDTFQTCAVALTKLRDAAAGTWESIRLHQQQLALERRDPRRRGSAVLQELSSRARQQLAAIEAAASSLQRALAGLVHEVSIDSFIIERIEPLEEAVHGMSSLLTP